MLVGAFGAWKNFNAKLTKILAKNAKKNCNFLAFFALYLKFIYALCVKTKGRRRRH